MAGHTARQRACHLATPARSGTLKHSRFGAWFGHHRAGLPVGSARPAATTTAPVPLRTRPTTHTAQGTCWRRYTPLKNAFRATSATSRYVPPS